MQAIVELEIHGYRFYLQGDDLRFELSRPLPPDTSNIQRLLDEIRKNKDEAIKFIRGRAIELVQLKIKYNELLERERKGELYLDDPKRTDKEIEKAMPIFQGILEELNQLLLLVELACCTTVEERMNGFNVLPLLGKEVSIIPEFFIKNSSCNESCARVAH